MRAFESGRGRHVKPELRGYGIMYYQGQMNHCPGCGRSHWHVGRISAQCAFCETSLPFALSVTPPIELDQAA